MPPSSSPSLFDLPDPEPENPAGATVRPAAPAPVAAAPTPPVEAPATPN